MQRCVANDAFVDLDTVRYSVPYGLVRERVEVWATAAEVRVFHNGIQIATHARCFEPHVRVVDPVHHRGSGAAPRSIT